MNEAEEGTFGAEGHAGDGRPATACALVGTDGLYLGAAAPFRRWGNEELRWWVFAYDQTRARAGRLGHAVRAMPAPLPSESRLPSAPPVTRSPPFPYLHLDGVIVCSKNAVLGRASHICGGEATGLSMGSTQKASAPEMRPGRTLPGKGRHHEHQHHQAVVALAAVIATSLGLVAWRT